jgi:hypothetical protein
VWEAIHELVTVEYSLYLMRNVKNNGHMLAEVVHGSLWVGGTDSMPAAARLGRRKVYRLPFGLNLANKNSKNRYVSCANTATLDFRFDLA